MKTRRTVAIIYAGALSLCTGGHAQNRTPLTPEVTKRIDAIFAGFDNTRSPGCALGVSRNGQVVYTRGYGMASLEHDIPISPESTFNVASVSKQFTAFAIVLLANDGKLSLDDDVRKHVPEIPDYGHKITIRHLLNHTSGLRDDLDLSVFAGWGYGDVRTQQEMLTLLARQKALNFRPGEEFLYSNGGFDLAAVIVKRVSGQSLREFAKARIFTPLGMTQTQFIDDHTLLVRRLASAYSDRDGVWAVDTSAEDVVGASGVHTTVNDLLKWTDNLSSGQVGGRPAVDALQTMGQLIDGTPINYGLGLVVGVNRGVKTVGHSGSWSGFRAQLTRFVEDDAAIAMLCNCKDSNPGGLIWRVRDALMGTQNAPRSSAVALPPGELAPLAGTYWNKNSDHIQKAFFKDGKLTTGQPATDLIPVGEGRFLFGGTPLEFRFPPTAGSKPRELHTALQITGPPGPGKVLVYEQLTAPKYSSADLKVFVGDYRSDELQVNYSVTLTQQGGLAIHRPRFEPMPLETIGRDMFIGQPFYWAPVTATITFVRSAGKVTGFTLSEGRVRRLPFTRVANSR